MAKSKRGLGTYSNDGLGSIIGSFSDEDMLKARIIVDNDLKQIKIDLIEQLNRLDGYIKGNGYPIPKTEDFVNWFFDQKKIYETGKKLPKISDDILLKYIVEYYNSLNNIINSEKLLKSSKGITSPKWIDGEDKLENLRCSLIASKFISSETTFEVFKIVFSGIEISSIVNKVIWIKKGKNKMPNKKSISDFIDVLIFHNLIEDISDNIPKILSHCFTSTLHELIFTHSNLSKKEGCSEFRLDLEKIVKSI